MVKGWYYKLKKDREPKFVKIWVKYFPEHCDRRFSKNASYGININGEVQTKSDWEKNNWEDCVEIELDQVENYLSGNKEKIYELW